MSDPFDTVSAEDGFGLSAFGESELGSLGLSTQGSETDSDVLRRTDGFGIGGNGASLWNGQQTADEGEPFGSVKISLSGFITPVADPGTVLPPPRRGAVILGGSVFGSEELSNILSPVGIVKMGHASFVDSRSSGVVFNRRLVFE